MLTVGKSGLFGWPLVLGSLGISVGLFADDITLKILGALLVMVAVLGMLILYIEQK